MNEETTKINQMTSRELIINALTFKPVSRIPIDLESGIPQFESDTYSPSFTYGKGRASGEAFKKGEWIDDWGCKWSVGEDGVLGEVKEALIQNWDQLDTFSPPYDVLEEADFSQVNVECAKTDKFTIHMWRTEVFQRMQYLRGTEQLFMDLAFEDPDVFRLRDMIHSFYLKKVEMWAKTDIDAIHFEDDWGTQQAMLISPDMWRSVFKPLYKDYCDIAHRYGKFTVMHSDGNIEAILPDLIEIGVDAVNAQLDCMDLDKVAAIGKGKIAFWGGFDRQYLLPFGTEQEVRAEVQRLAKTLLNENKSGIIGQCFRDKGANENNVVAVFDEWLKI